MLDEGFAVGGVGEIEVEYLSVVYGLLDASCWGVVVVFGFDDGYWIVVVEEDVVGSFAFGYGVLVADDEDASVGEAVFLSHIGRDVPAFFVESWGDELGSCFLFCKFFLVGVHTLWRFIIRVEVGIWNLVKLVWIFEMVNRGGSVFLCGGG